MKQVLEGHRPTHRTLTHLDRCLTCRACETTCPSGVEYGRLADIGRELVEERVRRSWLEILARSGMRFVFARPLLVWLGLLAGRIVRPFLPAGVGRMVPPLRRAGRRPAGRHRRRMLVLSGCVQRAAEPRINAAAARVFDRLGISLVRARGETCCGAIDHHLTAPARAPRTDAPQHRRLVAVHRERVRRRSSSPRAAAERSFASTGTCFATIPRTRRRRHASRRSPGTREKRSRKRSRPTRWPLIGWAWTAGGPG